MSSGRVRQRRGECDDHGGRGEEAFGTAPVVCGRVWWRSTLAGAAGDSERHLVPADVVELPVMARALGVATSAELVVVPSNLSEVLSSEGDGEVVEDRRMPIPFETSDGC